LAALKAKAAKIGTAPSVVARQTSGPMQSRHFDDIIFPTKSAIFGCVGALIMGLSFDAIYGVSKLSKKTGGGKPESSE
jgi:hypothetical protein